MDIIKFTLEESDCVQNLFYDVFLDSEGLEEGHILKDFVKALIETTQSNDLRGYLTYQNNELIASVFFSRVKTDSKRDVFILSPMAVRSNFQKQGIGQSLIKYGLNQLEQSCVDIILTYGDPSFYVKAGFQNISEELIRPPFKLSYPQGWLGLSFLDEDIKNEAFQCSCVNALNNSALW